MGDDQNELDFKMVKIKVRVLSHGDLDEKESTY